MKISRVVIKNYRNIENIDIHLSDTVTLIGENNSGKSNFLRAITLPFFTDETSLSGKIWLGRILTIMQKRSIIGM